MFNRTQSLLEAARWVIDESMNPDTGGRSFGEAIINLQEIVNFIDEEESSKKSKRKKSKKINLDENDGKCSCKTKPCVCWHDEK
jgi:hypothetical protein